MYKVNTVFLLVFILGFSRASFAQLANGGGPDKPGRQGRTVQYRSQDAADASSHNHAESVNQFESRGISAFIPDLGGEVVTVTPVTLTFTTNFSAGVAIPLNGNKHFLFDFGITPNTYHDAAMTVQVHMSGDFFMPCLTLTLTHLAGSGNDAILYTHPTSGTFTVGLPEFDLTLNINETSTLNAGTAAFRNQLDNSTDVDPLTLTASAQPSLASESLGTAFAAVSEDVTGTWDLNIVNDRTTPDGNGNTFGADWTLLDFTVTIQCQEASTVSTRTRTIDLRPRYLREQDFTVFEPIFNSKGQAVGSQRVVRLPRSQTEL
jgi:hypothetical protein